MDYDMTLADLGYTEQFAEYLREHNLRHFEPARVIAEHKERYLVCTGTEEYGAEITGTLRFGAQGREDFPAVGDWVAVSICDTDFAVIHAVLPRFSLIKRQAVGRRGEVQLIAANIDCAFLLQAVDRDFSINRLERYLSICYAANVDPVIVMSKIDLIDEGVLTRMLDDVHARMVGVPVLAISNESGEGCDALADHITAGKSYCLLGSSGVGKSTLLNRLAGRDLMRTAAISESTDRGKHVTSHRELVVLDSGGILIDNPGMREVGIADALNGLEHAFDNIVELGRECRFSNCTHTSEAGCRVIAALGNGELDRCCYENYRKMKRECVRFETTVAERRKQERIFGKLVKDYKKIIRKNPGQKL